MNSPSSSNFVRILAVVVLYKMAPEDSPTLGTLMQTELEAAKLGILDLCVVVQDNTPGGQVRGGLSPNIRYIAAPHNPGLSSAYNRAITIASEEGYDWLITLDQDTQLPLNFLPRMAQLATELNSSPEIGAIVPSVISDGRAISPFRFVLNAIPRWFPHAQPAVLTSATYSVNSAAMLRLAALREVGGYDLLFPLDISDISLFHRLHLAGKKVFFAADVEVAHEFSIHRRENRMNLERYRSLLLDECAFWDMYMGSLGRAERMVRLAGRLCKDLANPAGRVFCAPTAAELLRRLTTSRKRRIAQWRQWSTARMIAGCGAPESLTPAPESRICEAGVEDPENTPR